MSNFNLKNLLVATALLSAFSPVTAKAADKDIGHYIFGISRSSEPKIGVDHISHQVEDNDTSAKAFYPGITSHQISYFKNIDRNLKDAIGYGDWNKKYRQIIGVAHDYKRNKSSSSSYGYKDNAGSFYALGDKLVAKNIRLGGGAILTKTDGEYSNSIAHYAEEDVQGVMYMTYNNPDIEVSLRSRVFLGYGNSDIKRKSLDAGSSVLTKDSFDNYYYGTVHSLSKTFSHDGLFLQTQAELYGLGVHRGKIDENGNSNNNLRLSATDTMLWDTVLEAFVGVKGKDTFNNSYSFKVGPSLTYILTDAYDSFAATKTNGNEIYFGSKRDERDYITWKAYATYKLENNLGFYGDVRYHNKDDANISFALGINYSF